jgi:bacterioferritin-associated ferredoxin
MFLCVCNAITDDQVEWAVRERGATSVAEVFETLAAKPDCGRCLGAMAEAVLAIRAGEPVRVGHDPLATPWGCPGRCKPAWGAPAAVAKAS